MSDSIAKMQPPPRFKDCRFSTFQINSDYPNQEKTIRQLQRVIKRLNTYTKANPLRRFYLRKRNKIRGLYLDGPFGVGKTHLLTAAFHEFDGRKLYLSFSDLMHYMHYFGTSQFIQEFEPVRLLCLDEFELDDPGNTMKARRFISEIVDSDTFIITTSNTVPGELGQGRFSAKNFATEIGEISGFFRTIHIDGADYRYLNSDQQDSNKLKSMEIEAGKERISFADLNKQLASLPAVEIQEMIHKKPEWVVQLTSFIHQDLALRFCYFIDKIYDENIRFYFERDTDDPLFPDEFLNGPYEKKYKRCLSRLNEIANFL